MLFYFLEAKGYRFYATPSPLALYLLISFFTFSWNYLQIQLPMQKLIIVPLLLSIFLYGCSAKSEAPQKISVVKVEEKRNVPLDAPVRAATIIQRKQVPILCYHRLENKNSTSDYTVSINSFKEQLKLLADSGYHSILPDQLNDYLIKGTPLPTKPFMLTFDDTRHEHYSIAAPEMEKYGFKGVFFVMTIPIGRPNYMTS